jgi:hypothetical protein
MARMIPSVVSPEIKSSAERRIFEWFKNSKGSENWIVLHSLGIANHKKLVYGEIDFLVLAPGLGMFALEVKGGRISREEGMWLFTNRYGKTGRKARGPFEQAWDGIHSIARTLKKQVDSEHKHLGGVFFGVGVMFPNIEYHVNGVDEEPWQVFDINSGDRVVKFIEQLSANSITKYESVYNRKVTPDKLMSIDDAVYLAGLLRGDFDSAVAIGTQIRNSEREVVKYTSEQYLCIDQLEDNPRCLIRGGAGTGKTLIAIQEAIRAKANGQRVALLCYNNNLGRWLGSCFSDPSLKPDYVGTLHSLLTEKLKQNGTGYSIPKDDKDKIRFYESTLPAIALEIMTDTYERYDVLIIDEAQDLITPIYLNVFDALVTGGLSRGRWRMFGDFSMQAIYSKSKTADTMAELLDSRTSYIKFKLTINCRNTKSICEEICTVTGYQPPSAVWTRVEGPPVNYVTYSDEHEGITKLQKILEDLIGSGIESGKITILSPVKRENSLTCGIRRLRIDNYTPGKKSSISFCTIQGFKGLENTIIVLADIDSFSNSQLMYVGLSRATTCLYVIESNDAANEYSSLQQRRYLNG